MSRLDASQVTTFSSAGPLLDGRLGTIWLFGETNHPVLACSAGLLTLGGILWTSRPTRSFRLKFARPEPRMADA